NRKLQAVSRFYPVKTSVLFTNSTPGLPAAKIGDIITFVKRKVLFLQICKSIQRIGGFYGGVTFRYRSILSIFLPVSSSLSCIYQIADPASCKSIKLCRPDFQTDILAAIGIGDLHCYRQLFSQSLQGIPDIIQISYIDS